MDNVIQKGLFKTGKKTETLIGFVDIQAMFDKRVKKLFEDEVRCPAELEQIKKKYMWVSSLLKFHFFNPKKDRNLSSAFGPSFKGLKSGVVSRPHNDYLFFQDHSEQMHDQLHEPEGWFWGFEQIPKDLMHKGELL